MGYFGNDSQIKIFSFFVLTLLIITIFPSAVSAENKIDDFYYSYDEFTNLIHNMQEEFPEIFLCYSLGKIISSYSCT